MKFWFLLKEGFRGYKTSKLSFFLTVFTCFIALSVLGLFSYLFYNANLLVEQIKNRIEIEAFFVDTLSNSECIEAKNEVIKFKEVKSANFISKEEAKKKFLDETGIDFEGLLTSNPLPASISIEIKDSYKNIESIRKFIKELSRKSYISEVVFNQELLSAIQERAKLFQNIFLIVLGLVTLATVYLISNTIKLNLYNRIDDIKTMKLVGAMPYFIKLPFIIEGIIVGSLGGIFASVFLLILNFSLANFINFKSLIQQKELILLCFAIIVIGIFFGYLGSKISIRKFFKKADLFS